VTRRNDGLEGVIEQVGDLEVLVERAGKPGGVVDDRQVELARPHERDRLARLGLDQRRLDVGMVRMKRAQRRNDDGRAGAGERAQTQGARPQTRDRRQLVLRGGEVTERRLGMREHRPAGVGLDAATDPL